METTLTKQPQPTNRALGLIFFIMLMDVVGFTILIPIAPYIVKRYRNDALMVTLLSAIYAGAQFIAAPILGQLSDRVGRRPVLLVSVLGSAIGYFIFGIGGALWVLFLSRLIDGITAGNRSTAVAYVVDVSAPEDRARNFALMGVSGGLGFILGPAIGGALGQISIDLPLFAAGVVSLLSAVVIFFALPESLPKERRQATPLQLQDLNPLTAIAYMVRKSSVGTLLLVNLLFNLAFEGTQAIGGVFIIQKFHAEPWQIGGILAFAGVATTIMQAVFTGRLVARFGEKRMALVSLSAYIVGGLLIFFAPSLWLLYPIIFLQTAVGGFIFATIGALLARGVADHEQGQLAGVDGALGGLAAMLGPLWAGLAYDHVMVGSPFWIASIIFFVAFLLLRSYKTTVQPAIADEDAVTPG